MKAIPNSVLNVLKAVWKRSEGYSSFESVFNSERDERRRKPSYYSISKGKEIEYENWDVLTHKEAVELVRDNVFDALAIENAEDVVINEHAQHAFTDFCSEVYDSWHKFRNRLDQIKAQGAFPERIK